MMRSWGIVLFALLPSLFACKGEETATILESRLNALEETAKELREELKALQADLQWRNVLEDLDTRALLRPDDTGYSVVRFDLGHLTVKLEDVQAYANGSRVQLRFGNPLASTIKGLRTKVVWGPLAEDGTAALDAGKSREITFSERLNSGAWTSVDVVLEGVPPTSLGYVIVSDLGHSGIELIDKP